MNDAKLELVNAVVALIRSLANDGILPRDLATATIEPTSTLESLALDSMGKMDLLSAVDEKLGIYVPEDKINPEMTLGAIADLLSHRRAKA
jgi:acyl carrier protein